MGVHSIHTDRPHESILPRAYTSESQRLRDYGPIESMAGTKSMLNKLFWTLAISGVGGAVVFIGWPVLSFGFERINLW